MSAHSTPTSTPTPTQLLALNIGSSSLKFAVFDELPAGPVRRASGQVDAIGVKPRLTVRDADGRVSTDLQWPQGQALPARDQAIDQAFDWMMSRFPGQAPRAIGHRVVMGGAVFGDPVLVDDGVMEKLQALAPLAPLHQPACLAGIRAAQRLFAGVPQVACLDTAFHRRHPFVNDSYGLPRSFYEAGVRRFGFHGLSYDFIAHRLRQVDPQAAAGRVIVAHLGNGASICAMANGQSVDSTMGFSTLDGLPMGTRCGQIDPGVLLWMMTARNMSADDITQLLYYQSGFKGMSGISSDLRELEASDSPHATEAIDYFVSRVRREIGALAASLGGVDAIVFTGGIGEHSARIRRQVLAGMQWLGIEHDPAAGGSGERLVSTPGSVVKAWVIPTDEEVTIARYAATVVGPAGIGKR